MNAKFSAGEVVILQSPERPDLNGECTVKEAVKWGSKYTCRLTGRVIECCPSNNAAFVYRIEEHVPTFDDGKGHIVEYYFKETSLRKRHQPSEFSFNSLMDNLKLPQKA